MSQGGDAVMKQDNNHEKKMIAPAVITVIIVIYIIFCVFVFSAGMMTVGTLLFAMIIGIALVGVAISVFLERIREIRSGEEDDLSKY